MTLNKNLILQEESDMIEKVLEFIGGFGVETFCFGALYEPTVPEELRSIVEPEK